MTVILPGGDIATGFGGKLMIGAVGSDLDTSPGNIVRLDVGRWIVQDLYRGTEVTHSGCLGAIARRRTAFDYLFRCELPFDKQLLAQAFLARSDTVAISFYVGDPTQYVDGQSPIRKFSPSALVDDVQTVCDSTGTDVVRLVVTGHGNSLMFLIPDQQDVCNQYIAALRERGWL